MCFYFNSDFQGARADYAYSDAGLGNELFTDGRAGRNRWGVQVSNNAASVINNTGKQLYWYKDANCDYRDASGNLHPAPVSTCPTSTLKTTSLRSFMGL